MVSSRNPHVRPAVRFGLLFFLLFLATSARSQTLTRLGIGNDAGALSLVGTNGYDISARGRGPAITSDQFTFVQAPWSGDFDLRVRVDDLTISHPFVRAGLMIRTGPETNAAFAAVHASSALTGCFFESRTTAGGNPVRATAPGGFPATQPDLWLRLQRQGNVITGFAGTDGRTWTRLGSMTLVWPDLPRVGFAVSSQNPDTATTARFRSFGPTLFTTESSWIHPREAAYPSSRRTGLVFTEIQYDPGTTTNGTAAPAFVEIANHGDLFQDLTGWTLDGGIQYRFPDGFRLEAGAVIVVAAAPETLRQQSDLPLVLGPWTGALDPQGDTIELRDALGAIKLSVPYEITAPWPISAAGTGHSLVLISPSYGEADPRAWGPSRFRGGSPGRRDPAHAHPDEPVVINEFLAHSSAPARDFIELYNRSTREVDLSDCILTDSLDTPRFRIPPDTRIGPGQHRVWDESVLGFALRAAGETLYLLSPDAQRVLDVLRFNDQENGVSSGRSPDGSDQFHRLASPTPGAANAARRAEEIVINEIFFNPPGGDADEFIELHHRGESPILLNGWRIRGGIEFDFPPGTVIEPGQQVVIAMDPTRLRANHPDLPAARVVGPYKGRLGNSGDLLQLSRPIESRTTNSFGVVTTEVLNVQVGEVRYVDGGAWGRWSDGGGSSLELIDPDADPTLASNWADSDESTKADWSVVEWTGRLDNGNPTYGLNRFFLGLLNDGECLVDDIEVIRGGSTNVLRNGTFEESILNWVASGNHAGSSFTNSAARNGSRGLHLRAQGGLDTGINSIRGTLLPGLANGQSVTIRASVRWIAGWPELLFRLRGNFADFAAPLPVPGNLGTPGRPNSRRIPNAGPALHHVAHSPVLPRSGDDVFITAQASDPDDVSRLVCRYRIDPSPVPVEVPMNDDGEDGDVLAGDGIHTARIPGRVGGVLMAFTIEATDGAGATAIWPRTAPLDEGLVRWNEPIPFGSFPHVHLWTRQANRSAAGGNALNNAYRHGSLVYGNTRVIHSVLFRDKGSPFHNGSGDMTARVPDDELLHGVSERLFSRTGNGGPEETGLRTRVANWLASQMGVPSLSGKYQLFYINGVSFANVTEDLEEPDHRYAEHHYPDGGAGDLYKISIWFEFADDNRAFNATQATLQSFLSAGQLKTARYRWNWERRAQEFPENDYTTIFDLVSSLNSTVNAGFHSRVLQHADIDQWMRVFAFHRVTGNWDSWTYNVGQNMYLYRQPGRPAVLMPWDIDFVLGLGDGPTANLWGGQDPIANSRIYDQPPFRRMLWRALLQAAEGPMQPQNYLPVVQGYRAVQIQNNIAGLASISGITNYLNGRRNNILSRYRAADAPAFAITSNGGNDFTASSPTVTLAGSAPFRIADIAVNGVRYPVTWTSFTSFSLTIPLTAATNSLQLVGLDPKGNALPDSDSIRITYPGAIPAAHDWVVLNEIHYNPALPNDASTGFIELHNRHASVAFNLSGHRLDGVGYTFPDNAVIAPGGFLVLVSNRAAFAARFGAGTPLFDEFPGGLNDDGERLQLVPPDASAPFSTVVYLDRNPWPAEADGSGPSLQLIDPAQDPRRPANWAVTATNAPNRVTPGAPNSTRADLPPFPTVWINELFPNPTPGVVDNAGEPAPFVELHNPGPSPADIGGLWLSDSLQDRNRWSIPAGTSIAAGGYLRIWLDAQPNQSSPSHLHAPFTLPESSGQIVLSRSQGSPASFEVLDWVEYSHLPPGRGFGSVPDGNPFTRRQLYNPTPGAPNDPAVPLVQVVLNEFMAQNTTTLADPADGDFDDWIELHNPAASPVDLSGYFLSDNLDNRTQSILPPGTVIPAGGFLLVWADGEPGQNDPPNGRFHTSFSLSRTGEQIGLFAPDGSTVDSLTFETQTTDVSQGRFPDGPDGDWLPMSSPTPGQPNTVPGGNTPPRFTIIPPQSIPESSRWSIRLQATDPDPGQTIRFHLGSDAPVGVELDPITGDLAWTPDESQGPGTFRFTVRATDSGTPNRTGSMLLTVQVAESNQAPVLDPLPSLTIDEGSLLTLALTATDADLPPQTLTFSLGTNAPTGMTVDPGTGILTWIPSEEQGPGSYEITFLVSDSAFPPGSNRQTRRITVLETDNPPVIAQPSPQFVTEGSGLVLQLEAHDPDGAPIRYALQIEPPPGLTLDPLTGILRWTPTEAQGPASYPILIQVTEQSALAQTAQVTFSIFVEEDNQPPTLPTFDTFTRLEGDVLELVIQATDPDLPPQVLTWSLDNPVPPGAGIDPNTGVLRWTLPADTGPALLTAQVRVQDDPFPSGTAVTTVRVQLQPRFRVHLSEIMNRPATANAAYIELHNPSAFNSWDLSGARLSGDNLDFTFPAGSIINPLQVACIVAHPPTFNATYGADIPIAGTWSGSLGRDGDDLQLRAVDGSLLDRVRFSAVAPWPAQSPAGGAALQVIDPFIDNAQPANWTLATPWGDPRPLLSLTSNWRFYESGIPPAGWNGVTFNDSSWRTGSGLFFVESASLPAPRNTPLTLGQWSYYFRTTFVLPQLPSNPSLSLTHVIDDGAVFHLNGSELSRFNFNTGTVIGPSTPAAVTVGDAVSVGPVTLPANLLQTGTNVLAVQVHQSALGSSDIVFGAALQLDGDSLPGLSPGQPNRIGIALADIPTIHLNELQPVAGSLLDARGDAEPWVELFNSGSTVIDLTRWTLASSANPTPWSFPVGSTLPPGQRRIVFLDAEPDESTTEEWHASFSPSPNGGWISLARPAIVGSGVVDTLTYEASAAGQSWSAQPEGQSYRYAWTTPTPAAPNPVVAPPIPALTAIWDGATVILQWLSSPDIGYRLFAAESLDGPWLSVSFTVGTGSRIELPIRPPLLPTRFYRVEVEAR